MKALCQQEPSGRRHYKTKYHTNNFAVTQARRYASEQTVQEQGHLLKSNPDSHDYPKSKMTEIAHIPAVEKHVSSLRHNLVQLYFIDLHEHIKS